MISLCSKPKKEVVDTIKDEVESTPVRTKKQAAKELDQEQVKIVKVCEPSKSQAEHLAKARERAREVRTEKKRKEKESKAVEE